MALLHTAGNPITKRLGLLEAIKAGFEGRINILDIILIVSGFFEFTRSKRQTSFAHRTNLLRKRLNAEN